MKGNKTIRIILGIVLLILLGIYLYLTGSARTNGKKFQELAAATQTGKFKAACPDRFFDVNEGRGWRTNSGKPVDDWKKLAAVWDRNEHPKAATPPARTEPKANAVGKIPSVEEVMAKWGCDRETAQGYIDENMY